VINLNFGKPAIGGQSYVCVVTGVEVQKDKVNYPYPSAGKLYASLSKEEKAAVDNAPMEKNKFQPDKDIIKKQDVLLVSFEGEGGERFGKFDLSFRLWNGSPGQDLKAFTKHLGIPPAELQGNVDIEKIFVGRKFKATAAEPDDRGYDHIDKKSVRSVSDPDTEPGASVGGADSAEKLELLKAYMTKNALVKKEMTPAFLFDTWGKSADLQAIGSPNEINKLLSQV
jgi:hypothetical protein